MYTNLPIYSKKCSEKKGKKLIDEAEEEFENENDVNRLKTNIPKVVLHSASSSHTASFNDGKSKVCLIHRKALLNL